MALVFLAACGHPVPGPAAYDATAVQSSFGRTWASTLDELSRRAIPIKSVDRESGVIITDELHLDPSYYKDADCGSAGFASSRFDPTIGTFSFLVRGDSTRSNVRASVRFISVGSGQTALCSTLGLWETEFQRRVRDLAEKK